MPMPRMYAGLLGLALAGLTALPAAAQSWPSDAGPTGDYLGFTLRQFERLSPPPIEQGRGERVVPNLSPADVPGSVDVGVPSYVPPPLPPAGTRTFRSDRTETRRSARRRGNGNVRPASGPVSWDDLRRELADRDRQIEDLQRQLDQERRSRR